MILFFDFSFAILVPDLGFSRRRDPSDTSLHHRDADARTLEGRFDASRIRARRRVDVTTSRGVSTDRKKPRPQHDSALLEAPLDASHGRVRRRCPRRQPRPRRWPRRVAQVRKNNLTHGPHGRPGWWQGMTTPASRTTIAKERRHGLCERLLEVLDDGEARKTNFFFGILVGYGCQVGFLIK